MGKIWHQQKNEELKSQMDRNLPNLEKKSNVIKVFILVAFQFTYYDYNNSIMRSFNKMKFIYMTKYFLSDLNQLILNYYKF